MTFAFNAVGGGAVTADGAGQAGGAPNSLIGGGVSAPVTASANSGPAGIGVTFAFNTAGGGAVTQNGAGQAGGAPNSLIGGGVSAPVTASANSGPAGIGVTFAFNTAGGGAVTQNGADPERCRPGRRGTQLAHRRRRICTGYGVCEQRPGRDRSDLCV